MTTGACLFVRNELHDLAEWVAHHAGIGFDRLVIYDNCSDDGTAELIGRLAASYPIDHVSWADDQRPVTGLTKQGAAYTDCIERYRDRFSWLAFLDADEFLIPPATDAGIDDLLARCHAHEAIALNWMFFGSNGLDATRGRLVMEAFDRRARLSFGPNRHVKMIVRPDRVVRNVNPHYFETVSPCVNLDGGLALWSEPGISEIGHVIHGDWRLHHYFVRSREHWARRLARRQPNNTARSMADFDAYDINEVADGTALAFARKAAVSLARAGFAAAPVPIPAEDDPPCDVEAPPHPPSALLCVVDAVEDGTVRGWAVDTARAGRRVVLRARFDDAAHALAVCDLPRADVMRSEIKREHVGFKFRIPAEAAGPGEHTLEMLDDRNKIVNFALSGRRWLKYRYTI